MVHRRRRDAALGPTDRNSEPATKEQLHRFFEHLEEELDLNGFLRNIEKRPSMVRNSAISSKEQTAPSKNCAPSMGDYRLRRTKGPDGKP